MVIFHGYVSLPEGSCLCRWMMLNAIGRTRAERQEVLDQLEEARQLAAEVLPTMEWIRWCTSCCVQINIQASTDDFNPYLIACFTLIDQRMASRMWMRWPSWSFRPAVLEFYIVWLNFLSKPCRQAWSRTFGGRRQWSPSGNWCRWVLDFRDLQGFCWEKSWEFRQQWIHYGLQMASTSSKVLMISKATRLPLSDATNFAAVQWMEKGLETSDEGSFFHQYCAARRPKKIKKGHAKCR